MIRALLTRRLTRRAGTVPVAAAALSLLLWPLLGLGGSNGPGSASGLGESFAGGHPVTGLAAQQPPDAEAEAAEPEEEDEEAEEWDVQTSLGFDRTLELETDEGTWLNVDVSPDGTWLAFDLLGDIYRLPIEGGEAEPLTSGPAFDQFPRISPDGRTIAFVSDRGGADNVWLMAADGSDPRPLTEERETLPTNPVWTPDGEYVVVKRHVTDTRSLGGGEIWMYHVRGGDGVRLVEKESFTSDINEPALSADGRWVYYSRSGPFDYNRNVHQGIFDIHRFDRREGETERVTGEAGGAVRPTPSPDGRSLAFVRRLGTETALMVRDLESGRDRAVYRDLDPDQMETWTVHGAYPAFAWLPDGREVVVYAGGGLRRVSVANGSSRAIPFRARVSVPMTELAHFPQRAVEGDSVRARVIRWPQLTPDGRRAVFQAFGRLWQMALPDGRPERVTQGELLEFAPALSPDGAWVAFTTWSDDEGGALWRARLRPGARSAPERLTRVPGQYANPAWSPDGRRIAFVQGSGRVNRGADLGAEFFLRLRWVPAEGGEIRDITTTRNRGPNRRMPRLAFSPEGDRLLFQETVSAADDVETVLTSVRLDGTDARRLVRNDVAEEIVPSPDGRWVAWKELHDLYVAPLPRAGKDPVTLARRGSPMPVRRLTRYGGDWVSWTADGRSLYWVYGPHLAVQRVEDVYAEPADDEDDGEEGEGAERGAEAREAGAPADARAAARTAEVRDAEVRADAERNLRAPGELHEIRLRLPRARPEGRVALTGARIITMRGDEVIERGTVVVTGDRIEAVGPADEVEVPADARRIDVAGKTIIPGLIDVHAHMGYMALDVNPERPWQYYANLAYGVTTTHDPSASTQFVFSNAELVEAGRMVGPRIFSTGFVLYGARNPNRALIESPDDARAHLKRLKALGAFSVKSYNQLRRDARQWVIAAARQEGMMVYPEGGSMLQQNITQAVDGHTGIEHALPVAPLYRDVVRLMADSGTGYTPTLVVGYGGVWGENYWYQVDDVYADERLRRFVPGDFLDARARRRMLVPEEEWWHPRLAEQAKKIVDAGGSVQLGAHGQLQGLAAHWELWMFTQGGMTELEALRAATLDGARYLGMEEELGSLEPGKLADLVVLDADPLEEIRNSERVHMVMKGGFLYDEDVNERWPRERARSPLRHLAGER